MVTAAAVAPTKVEAARQELRPLQGATAAPGAPATFSAKEDAQWRQLMPAQAALPAVQAIKGHPNILSKVADLSPVEVKIAGKKYQSLNPLERIRLCKEVAAEMKLAAHGLDWRNIYATVHAETGWAERTGMGLNGKPSFGLAQMETATAKSLGIDPMDKRSALVGVAMLLKEASSWAKAKGHADKMAALSVYYNLSSKARNQWDGSTLEALPQATRNHIRNLSDGLAHATRLAPKYDKLLVAAKSLEHEELKMKAQAESVAVALSHAPAAQVPVATVAVKNAAGHGSLKDAAGLLAAIRSLRIEVDRFAIDLHEQVQRKAQQAQAARSVQVVQAAVEPVRDPALIEKATGVIARHQAQRSAMFEQLAACLPAGQERTAVELQATLASRSREDNNLRMRGG